MQTKRNVQGQGQDSRPYGKEHHEECHRLWNNLAAAAVHFYLGKTNYEVAVSHLVLTPNSHLFSTLSFLLITISNTSQVPNFSNDFIPIHAEK